MRLAERVRLRVNRLVWGLSAAVMIVVPAIAWVGGSNAGPMTCVPPPAVSFPTTTTSAPNPVPSNTSPNSSPITPAPTQSTVDPVLASTTTAAPPDTGVPVPPDTGVPVAPVTTVASGGPVPLAAFAAPAAVAPPNTGPVPPDSGVQASSTSAAPAADTTPPPPAGASTTTTAAPFPVSTNCATTIERVSVDNNGVRVSQTQGVGLGRTSISADGRYVAFYSYDLLTPDASGGPNIYVRDRVQQTTTLVSNGPPPAGQVPNNMLIGMSADGHSVVFASNEVFGPAGDYDVYRRDMVTGATERVTPHSESGAQSFPPSSSWFLSANGRFLAFSTPGSWWNGGPGTLSVLVEDLDTLTTSLVAQSATHNYRLPSVSDDGRYVGYLDDETTPDVVVDRTTGSAVFSTQRGLGNLVVAPDGTKVAFPWRTSTFSQVQLAVADIATGVITLVTNGASGQNVLFGETNLAWSADSQRLAFTADYAVTPDSFNSVQQVFVVDLRNGQIEAAPRPGVAPDRESAGVAVAVAPAVAFSSRASNLVPDDGLVDPAPPSTVPFDTGPPRPPVRIVAREDVYVQGPPLVAPSLPTVTLRGVVSVGGSPVANVHVNVQSHAGAATMSSEPITDSSGTYSTTVLANSSLNLFAFRTLPDSSQEWASIDGEPIGSSDASQDIPLPGWVDQRFIVNGVGGGLIPGAEVRLVAAPIIFRVLSGGSPVRYQWTGPSTSCVTDATGACSLGVLADFTLTARVSYRVPGVSLFSVDATRVITDPPTDFAVDVPFAGAVPSSGSASGSVVVSAPQGMSISNVTVQTVLPDVLPADAVSLTGAVSYQVDGVPPGGTADVVLVLPPGSNPTAVYKILGGVAQDVSSIATISGDTIVVHLTDGGLGDGDGVANGVIVDPIVPVRTQATTATGIVTPASAVYGNPVTVTAAVAPDFGPSPAEGAVDFVDGASVVCAAVTLVDGQASCSAPLLAGGSHTLSARFAGSTYFLPSTSSPAVLVVSPAAATVQLTAPTSATSGSPVPLSAMVTGIPVGETPNGSVSFAASNGSSCTAALVNGAAGCSLASLPVGIMSVVARYGGSSNYAPADSASASITVVAPPTTVTLSSSPPTTVTGQPTLLRAAVSVPGGRLAAGTVRFLDGGRLLGSARLVAGVATLRVSFAAGDRLLTAVYIDATGTVRGQSSEVAQHVQRAATATAAVGLPLVGRAGKSTTIVAAVLARSPGAGVPTGQVRFLDGAVVLGLATLTSGVAVLTGVTFTRATHVLTVEYLGSANFLSSRSSFQYVVR